MAVDPSRTTLLHLSDCHLGWHQEGGSEEPAFAAAVDLAGELDVDAVLISGDLFDHARVSEELLAWTAAELDRIGRPVVLLPGNHDHALLERFAPGPRCQRVQVLEDPDGELLEIEGTPVTVWGRAMLCHEPAFRPLVGVPPAPAGRWAVLAGHGLVMDGPDSYRSSPIWPEDLQALDALGWDYLALGHVHEHRVVEAPLPACYAGATANSWRGEPGGVVVEFVPGEGARPRWVGLSQRAGRGPGGVTPKG